MDLAQQVLAEGDAGSQIGVFVAVEKVVGFNRFQQHGAHRGIFVFTGDAGGFI